MDAGFVKVLLATKPLDLRSIVRPVIAFPDGTVEESKQMGWGSGEGTTGCERSEPHSSEKEMAELWGTVMFCAIQRRTGSKVA
jgi:hypothetical protein